MGSWEVSSDISSLGIHRLRWEPDSQGAAGLGKEGRAGGNHCRKDVSVGLWKLCCMGAGLGKLSKGHHSLCPEGLLKQEHWPCSCILQLGF